MGVGMKEMIDRMVQPNYAIKVAAVKILASSLASGASAPYFGC